MEAINDSISIPSTLAFAREKRLHFGDADVFKPDI